MTWRERAELAGAAAVAAWRIAAPPPLGLWRDWILILAAYWMVLVLDRSGRASTWASAVVALYLLAVHAILQVPFTLDHLRLAL